MIMRAGGDSSSPGGLMRLLQTPLGALAAFITTMLAGALGAGVLSQSVGLFATLLHNDLSGWGFENLRWLFVHPDVIIIDNLDRSTIGGLVCDLDSILATLCYAVQLCHAAQPDRKSWDQGFLEGLAALKDFGCLAKAGAGWDGLRDRLSAESARLQASGDGIAEQLGERLQAWLW